MTATHSIEGDYFYSLLMMSVTNTFFCLAITEKEEVPKSHGSETAEQGYVWHLVTREEGASGREKERSREEQK